MSKIARSVVRRNPKSKRHDKAPSVSETLVALHGLHADLTFIVRQLDRLQSVDGLTPAQAWKRLGFTEGRPTRAGIGKTPAVLRALSEYAKSSVDHTREARGLMLATRAMDVVRGKLTATKAVKQARQIRGDDLPDNELAVVGALAESRTEVGRWMRVYAVLAWNADVEPRPDSRKVPRKGSELERLYWAVSRPFPHP